MRGLGIKSVLERLKLSEVKMCRGPPVYDKLSKRLQWKRMFVKSLNILSSTVYYVKRF